MVTPSGVCLECVEDAEACQCAPVGESAADPWAVELAGRGVVEGEADDELPPHPADDPAMNRRRGLRVVEPGERADDDGDDMLEPIPAYPADALVGPLADFVRWAVKDGLPAAAAGAAGLAALATVTGWSELALTSTFTVRPALWVLPVGGTGTGKSPAIEQAFRVIADLYDQERREWDDAAEVADDAKGAGPKPRPVTLTDGTLPAVARWLKGNQGKGCLVYDELAALLALAAFPANRAQLCEAWTARRPVHIQRVGDGGASNAIDIYISSPVLSICGPLTPDKVRDLGREGDGFRARWLVHLIDGQAQLLDAGPQPQTWIKTVTDLYGRRQRRTWRLTGRPRTAYEQACQRWRGELGQPYPQSVIEALRKADTQCARIALVLAESCADPAEYASADRGGIGLDVVNAAIALTDYVMACWRAMPGGVPLTLSMAEEKLSGAAVELFTWLENREKGGEGLPEGESPRPRATRREIQRARVGGAQTAANLSAMLAAYDAHWPGNVVTVEQGGKGGRMRAYYYFPKRAGNGVTGASIDVTVTTILAGASGVTPISGTGQRDAIADIDVTGSMSQPLCDIDPVTTIRADDAGAAGWPTAPLDDDDTTTAARLDDGHRETWPASSTGAEANE
jgi:hypothetical protein